MSVVVLQGRKEGSTGKDRQHQFKEARKTKSTGLKKQKKNKNRITRQHFW